MHWLRGVVVLVGNYLIKEWWWQIWRRENTEDRRVFLALFNFTICILGSAELPHSFNIMGKGFLSRFQNGTLLLILIPTCTVLKPMRHDMPRNVQADGARKVLQGPNPVVQQIH